MKDGQVGELAPGVRRGKKVEEVQAKGHETEEGCSPLGLITSLARIRLDTPVRLLLASAGCIKHPIFLLAPVLPGRAVFDLSDLVASAIGRDGVIHRLEVSL